MHRSALFVGLAVLMVSLSLQAAGAAATARPADAAIVLNRQVGPPTTQFHANGSGFGSSEAVSISFDEVPIGRARTTSSGDFSTQTLRVPRTATPGTHTVTASGHSSGSTASADFLVRTDWPTFHFDAANTGFNPYENVLNADNVSSLMPKWKTATAPGAAPDPVIAGGIVYVAPADGIVRALNATDGSLIWSHDTGGAMSGFAPTVSGGRVYVTNEAGDAVALSASTGDQLWSVDLGTDAMGETVADGTFYVGASDGTMTTVYALNASTGATRWSRVADAGAQAPVSRGLLYLAALGNCSVTALDTVSGAQAWQTELCSEEVDDQQAGAAANGALFGDFDGQSGDELEALDATNGDVLWGEHVDPGGSPEDGAPAVAYGMVFEVNRYLWAMNATTGQTVWMNQSARTILSSPAVANGLLFLGNLGDLEACDAITGTCPWISRDVGAYVSSPAVADGMVFVGSQDGVVHAYGLP